MTKDQIVKYDMYERVINCCNEKPAIVALIPVFKADLATLVSILPEIRRISGLINADNAHSDDKQKAKTDMLALGLNVCANLGGYGMMTKDKVLEKMGKYSKTSLGTGKEQEMLERCQNVAAKARELLPVLKAKRGMQESLLLNFEAAIVQFNTLKPIPRSSLQDKTTLIENLETAFADADIALALMTSCAVNFNDVDSALKNAAADFVVRFNRASTVISARTSATKVKFVYIDQSTKQKLSDVNVESTALKMSKTLISAKSAPIPAIPHEGSDFTFIKEGYVTVTKENVKIKKGQINIVVVEMMPIKAN